MGAHPPTESLGLQSKSLLRLLIANTQGGRFGPFETPQSDELSRPLDKSLLAGRRELADGDAYFSHFEGRLTLRSLAGRRVLDLGCGYGGRTVYYALHGQAEVVEGLEVNPEMVERCCSLAVEEGADRATFTIGRAEALPYETASVDLVISYDVLEHVDDPRVAFSEIERVLSPRGEAWLVFPSYLGARSSHLDYLTRLPALHRIFDPGTVVEVVNEFLATDRSRYRVGAQPSPQVGPFGRRTLPTLNGMSYRDSQRLIAESGLQVVFEHVTPALHPDSRIPPVRAAGRILSRAARATSLPELLIGAIALGLRR